jgi:hypothetical protein
MLVEPYLIKLGFSQLCCQCGGYGFQDSLDDYKGRDACYHCSTTGKVSLPLTEELLKAVMDKRGDTDNAKS